MNTLITTIGDLVSAGTLMVGDGYRTKRSELDDEGFRIVRVADVVDGRVRLSSPDFVTLGRAKEIGTKAGRQGDIVLTTKGSVGRVAVVGPLSERVVYSPQVCFFRVQDPARVAPGYLRYWFSSPDFLRQASHRMNNTDMAAYINLADIRSLRLMLPDLTEQRAIAEVLGALDDKIAATASIVATADELIRTTYAGLPHDSSVRISDLAEPRREHVDPKSLAGDEPYVGLEHLPRRRMWLQFCGSARDVSSGKSRFVEGDVLFGKLRPYFHKVVAASGSGICSTDVLAITPKDPELRGFVWSALSSDQVVRIATEKSEGTRMPRTSWTDLAQIEIPYPGGEEARAFSLSAERLSGAVTSLLRECRTLGQLRDTLLPQLMSGKLRVRDAENMVEGVL